jgi:hypothetical protein
MTETHHTLASTTFFLPPSIFHLWKLARFLQFKNCGTQLVTVPWVCDRGKHLLSLLGQSATKTECQSCLPHNICFVSVTPQQPELCQHVCYQQFNLHKVTMFRILTVLIITHFQTTDLTFPDKFWWTEMSHMVGKSVILLHCTGNSQLSQALSSIK